MSTARCSIRPCRSPHLPCVVDAVTCADAKILHLAVAVEKGMASAGGRIGHSGHLPRIVDGETVTPRASQRAQIPHLAVAVKKGMTTSAGGRIGRTDHLPRIVYAPGDAGHSSQRAQIRHAIENFCR